MSTLSKRALALNLAAVRRWKEKNKVKKLAHNAVRRAVLCGRLKRQPCARCGNPDAVAHHEDYSRRFDVIWLCVQHHIERHRGEKK